MSNETQNLINTTRNLLSQVNDECDEKEQEELQRIADAAPTISSSAMLVSLNISVWEGRKKDKRASEQVTTDNHAKRHVASVNKSLMADCEYLKAIKTHRGLVRNHIHYHYTLPWIHNGPALLTTKAYFHYLPAMQEAERVFWELVDEFLQNYQFEVAKAQADLGDLFDANEYPDPVDLRHKFAFNVDYIPLGETGDFRLDVQQETIDHLRDSYEKYYATRFNAAMADVWTRLMEPLANMVDRLDYGENETKKLFKNTLVDNVLAIVDLMGTVNITNDPNMTRIENTLRQALTSITPEALREDSTLRAQTRKVAVDALRETKQQIDNLPSIW